MTIQTYRVYKSCIFFGEQERGCTKEKEEVERENIHNYFPYKLLFYCTESSHHRVPGVLDSVLLCAPVGLPPSCIFSLSNSKLLLSTGS